MRILAIVVGAALLMPLGAVGRQVPGRHPGYLHALQDLRYARALLERGQAWNWGRAAADQQRAVNEIERAMGELRRAAMDDGKNPNEHPPIDANWQPHDRLRHAIEALDRARESISREEDNPEARAWRDRSFRHIDEARRALRHAVDTWH